MKRNEKKTWFTSPHDDDKLEMGGQRDQVSLMRASKNRNGGRK